MDIFVKFPNEETLHHYRTGDGEGSDAASFRANTLGGRTDLRLFDSESNELDPQGATTEELPEGTDTEPEGEAGADAQEPPSEA